MPHRKASIEELYEAIMEFKRGVAPYRIALKYHLATRTLRRLVKRYDEQGLEGLKEKKGMYYPQAIKLSALNDFEQNGLTLEEVSYKYDIAKHTFRHWQVLYEAYKKGDKYALNGGGAIHKGEIYTPSLYTQPELTTSTKQDMPESKERTERRKALSKLNKKELKELLLDREAELDILKKLEALAQEREMLRRATWRKSSRD